MARTIGQLARAAGVGVETIRFYERRGLIPRPPRPPQGYRRYGDDVLVRLRYIRLAQGLGLTLADVAELIARTDEGAGFCRAVRSTVEGRLAKLNAEIAALERLRDEMGEFLEICGARPPGAPCPTLLSLNLSR
jgi:DNA-binding transcriptional MerR regulator